MIMQIRERNPTFVDHVAGDGGFKCGVNCDFSFHIFLFSRAMNLLGPVLSHKRCISSISGCGEKDHGQQSLHQTNDLCHSRDPYSPYVSR